MGAYVGVAAARVLRLLRARAADPGRAEGDYVSFSTSIQHGIDVIIVKPTCS
jgi:hypothetical protein